MEHRGWVTAEWGLSANNRRAKFYSLTPLGRRVLRARTKSLGSGSSTRSIRSSTSKPATPDRRPVSRRRTDRSLFEKGSGMAAVPTLLPPGSSGGLRRGAPRSHRLDGRFPRRERVEARGGCRRGASPFRRRVLFRVRAAVDRVDVRQQSRQRWALTFETIVSDLRYALRGLRRNLSFTIVAALSIALGVAANATIFSVVNAILLRPIPASTPSA